MPTIYGRYFTKKTEIVNLCLITSCVLLCLLGSFYLNLRPLYCRVSYLSRQHLIFQSKIGQDQLLLKNKTKILDSLLNSQLALIEYFRMNNSSEIDTEILTQVQQASELAGFFASKIQRLQCKQQQNMNLCEIHLTAEGSLRQFLEFIHFLHHVSLPMDLGNFTLHRKKNLVFQMNMQLLGLYVPIAQNSFMRLKQSIQPLTPKQNKETLNVEASYFSIRQLKMIGYLHDDNCFFALLMLPDKNVVTASLGNVIGLEKARVISLNENQVLLQSSNQMLVIKNSI